jgi:hypothetical protein
LSIRARNAIRPERVAIEPKIRGSSFVNDLTSKDD